MRSAAPATLVLLLVLLAGCGPTESPQAPPKPSPPEAPASAPATPAPPPAPSALERGAVFAPYPYTPEQIRDACPAGRRIVFRVQQQGRELQQVMHFVESDAEGALVRSAMGPKGGEMQSAESRRSWGELQAHARYPASFTTVTETQVEVGAGTFAAKLYEVSDGEGGVVTRAWFADELPGPPVKMQNLKAGQPSFELEMVENEIVDPQATPAAG